MVAHQTTARFAPGTIVRHRRFGYRGLIFDVDAEYSQDEAFLEASGQAGLNKKRPWYHILIDGELHTSYVAEDNLTPCTETGGFDHPLFAHLFKTTTKNRYGFETRYIMN